MNLQENLIESVAGNTISFSLSGIKSVNQMTDGEIEQLKVRAKSRGFVFYTKEEIALQKEAIKAFDLNVAPLVAKHRAFMDIMHYLDIREGEDNGYGSTPNHPRWIIGDLVWREHNETKQTAPFSELIKNLQKIWAEMPAPSEWLEVIKRNDDWNITYSLHMEFSVFLFGTQTLPKHPKYNYPEESCLYCANYEPCIHSATRVARRLREG